MKSWLFYKLIDWTSYLSVEVSIAFALVIAHIIWLLRTGPFQAPARIRANLYKSFRWAHINTFVWTAAGAMVSIGVLTPFWTVYEYAIHWQWWILWLLCHVVVIGMAVPAMLTLKSIDRVPAAEILGFKPNQIRRGLGMKGPRAYVVQFNRETPIRASMHLRDAHPLAFFFMRLPEGIDNTRFAAHILRLHEPMLVAAGIREVELASHYVRNADKMVARAKAFFPGRSITGVERSAGWWKSGWISVLSRGEVPVEAFGGRQALEYLLRRIRSARFWKGAVCDIWRTFTGSARTSPFKIRGVLVELRSPQGGSIHSTEHAIDPVRTPDRRARSTVRHRPTRPT